ncbi:MAG: magnesium transporter [Planctomycetes bacterium]|nr:magnesium transporter [Planctomycetota bacterium]
MNSAVLLVIPEIRDLIRDGSSEDLAAALAPFHSADLADILEMLEDEEAVTLLHSLAPIEGVEAFEQLEDSFQVRLFETIGSERRVKLVALMSPDDRADLINNLPQNLVAGLLSQLPAEEAKDVATLANYTEETAGAIMTSDFVRLSPEMSTAEAIERVREQATSKETIFALYVLDTAGCLIGVASLRRLILAKPEDLVGDVMYPNPISLPVETDQEHVAERLRHYDFLAIPITDDAGRMIGIVTHDDAFDVVLEEQTEDVQKMAAVEPLEAAYSDTPVITLVRKRAVWLIVLLGAGLVAGGVLEFFHDELMAYIALTSFLPLIIAAGGNTGGQSATLVIRGMAVGDVKIEDWPRIAGREALSGLLLGLMLGILGYGMAHVMGQGAVGTTVGLTLVGIVTMGSLLGSLLPLLLARLKIDPAITSAPLIAGLIDILGIILYFLIAKTILGI